MLPFENLGDDKANARFVDGVHDEILTDLSRVLDLKVISRTSTMQYGNGVARISAKLARPWGLPTSWKEPCRELEIECGSARSSSMPALTPTFGRSATIVTFPIFSHWRVNSRRQLSRS